MTSYKKAGVIVGDIIPENQVQLNLFDIDSNHHKKKNLYSTVDIINQSMGRDKVQILGQGITRRSNLRKEKLSPCYTTQWNDLLKVHC